METSLENSDSSKTPTAIGESLPASKARNALPLRFLVVTGDNCPSFKNSKRSGTNPKTGKHCSYTPTQMKQRMEQLEQSIVSALLSASRMPENATDSAWQRRLLTVSLGLCDDSLKVVPEFSFDVRYVEQGQEGVEIEIEEI